MCRNGGTSEPARRPREPMRCEIAAASVRDISACGAGDCAAWGARAARAAGMQWGRRNEASRGVRLRIRVAAGALLRRNSVYGARFGGQRGALETPMHTREHLTTLATRCPRQFWCGQTVGSRGAQRPREDALAVRHDNSNEVGATS